MSTQPQNQKETSAKNNETPNHKTSTSDQKKSAAESNVKEQTFTKAEVETFVKAALDQERQKWEAEKDLSELERLRKQNEDLQGLIRLRDAKEKIVEMLRAAGNKSPELAFAVLKSDLKFDKNGKVENAEDLLESFKAAYPEQFVKDKPGQIDAGKSTNQKNDGLTVATLSKMTPDEINKLDWQHVKAVLEAEGK